MVKAGENCVVADADVIRSTTGVGVTSSIIGTGAAQRTPVTFVISISVAIEEAGIMEHWAPLPRVFHDTTSYNR